MKRAQREEEASPKICLMELMMKILSSDPGLRIAGIRGLTFEQTSLHVAWQLLNLIAEISSVSRGCCFASIQGCRRGTSLVISYQMHSVPVSQ